MKLKLDRAAPARELYVSPLWRRRREYAERRGGEWLILSAKYGLVDPERRIAPYDLALSDLPAEERRKWGARVIGQLEDRIGSLAGTAFEIHAGERVSAGNRAGHRRARRNRNRTAAGPRDGGTARVVPGPRGKPREGGPAVIARRRTSTDADFRAAVQALDEAPVLIAARDWPGASRGLDGPGLYSWCVDEAGARDLSRGLGGEVAPGRIYAGQTGATKWPSGTVGRATLRSRISSQHLRGRIRGSTFRLTLASMLASELDLKLIAPKNIGPDGEARVSRWMLEHLSVAVYPFAERDALADLEGRVLAELDPPLNLDGRPASEIRGAVTRLRAGGLLP